MKLRRIQMEILGQHQKELLLNNFKLQMIRISMTLDLLWANFPKGFFLAGLKHDFTKKNFEKEFYNDFVATMNEGADFVNGRWYQNHIYDERHHPLSYCHDDINLIDIIEMVVDCTVAGLARSGEVRPIEVNAEILNKSVANTTKLIQRMVVVTETEDK